MGLQIEDGKGSGKQAQVNDQNMLMVQAVTMIQPEFNSWVKAMSFSFSSSYNATAAQVVFYLKNTDPENHLHISGIIVGSASATLWTSYVNMTGTASGTPITPCNLNLSSSKAALASCYGNAAVTGLSGGNISNYVYSLASQSIIIPYNGGLILGYGNNISIIAGTSAIVGVTVVGYYEPAVVS